MTTTAYPLLGRQQPHPCAQQSRLVVNIAEKVHIPGSFLGPTLDSRPWIGHVQLENLSKTGISDANLRVYCQTGPFGNSRFILGWLLVQFIETSWIVSGCHSPKWSNDYIMSFANEIQGNWPCHLELQHFEKQHRAQYNCTSMHIREKYRPIVL